MCWRNVPGMCWRRLKSSSFAFLSSRQLRTHTSATWFNLHEGWSGNITFHFTKTRWWGWSWEVCFSLASEWKPEWNVLQPNFYQWSNHLIFLMKETRTYWNISKGKKMRKEEVFQNGLSWEVLWTKLPHKDGHLDKVTQEKEEEFKFKLLDEVIYNFKMLQLHCIMADKLCWWLR